MIQRISEANVCHPNGKRKGSPLLALVPNKGKKATEWICFEQVRNRVTQESLQVFREGLLVVMPGAGSDALAPSSDALCSSV